MNLKWDLTALFKNDEDFYKEIENVKSMLSDIKKYKEKTLDENLLLTLLNEKWKIKELTNKILVYGSLMYYKNVQSKKCIKLKATAEKFNNQVDLELSFIDKKILDLGKEKTNSFLAKNSKLKIYAFSLKELFRMQEHLQNMDINKIINENKDNINSRLNVYNNLLKDMQYGKIIIEGKKQEITSSNFAKYLASRDREVRKQTYLIVNQKFKEKENEFANILDLIYGSRINISKLEKYDSVLDKSLFEENIDFTIIKTLIEVVNSNLNLIQKYLKIKSDLLKIASPHLYDFGVPLDNNLKIKYTIEEAIEIIKKALKPLGNTYLKVVEKLLDGHIDAEPDENKHQSITFSWNTYSFMNFRGSYIDLKNLIHELGHIVHYYLSQQNLPFLYEDSTVFVGEVASIINEILLNRYLYENAKTKEEKLFYLSKQIENYFTSVFKQTMYTEFEIELYNTKSSQNLTAKFISLKYEELIKKYYGDAIVYDEVSNIEWMRLGHLYRWSYYPYKYATGLIIASTVVNSLLNEQSLSKEKYLEFLSSGSSLSALDLLKILNVDFTEHKIINNGFKELENAIEELENILSIK